MARAGQNLGSLEEELVYRCLGDWFPVGDLPADIGYHRLAGVQLTRQTELCKRRGGLALACVDESELESRVPVWGFRSIA